MSRYIMRLDDAAEKMNIAKWNQMEVLLDKYGVKPLVGVIPDCKDPQMEEYDTDPSFWKKVQSWQGKGWVIALHGYNHIYSTTEGGINPVNKRSEFAGEPLRVQKEKIINGLDVFRRHGIEPQVFFAPSHTFDTNTIVALKECSSIRVISDTVANKPYTKYGVTFVPQQSGRVRKLFFHTVTFCYHPNVMEEDDFLQLEMFLQKNAGRFTPMPTWQVNRKQNLLDLLLMKVYFARRKMK